MMLKFLLLFVTFACVSGRLKKVSIDEETSRFFEDQFNETIECHRGYLEKGYPERGIPSLDPWIFDREVSMDLNNFLLKSNLIFKQLVINGLSRYQIPFLALSPLLVMDADLHFDRIEISSLYSGELNILGLYTIYGEGTFNAEFVDVNIKIITEHQIMPPLVGRNSIELTLGKANLQIMGLMGDEELSKIYSIIASQTIEKLVKLFKKQISDWTSPILKNTMNEAFGHLAFLDYLAMITNFSCKK